MFVVTLYLLYCRHTCIIIISSSLSFVTACIVLFPYSHWFPVHTRWVLGERRCWDSNGVSRDIHWRIPAQRCCHESSHCGRKCYKYVCTTFSKKGNICRLNCYVSIPWQKCVCMKCTHTFSSTKKSGLDPCGYHLKYASAPLPQNIIAHTHVCILQFSFTLNQ